MGDTQFFERTSDPARFARAVARFDELNSADPNLEEDGDVTLPRELLNARRLCDWVMRLRPDASEELRLAARCQHLCRWEIPRSQYPMTRAGYHQWKNELKKFHATRSAAVLREVGYPEPGILRVSELNLKKGFPADPETRVLEDALCLVFLQYQFRDLAEKLEDDKTINALKKSWDKMTVAARDQALRLTYSDRELALIEKALEA